MLNCSLQVKMLQDSNILKDGQCKSMHFGVRYAWFHILAQQLLCNFGQSSKLL